MALFFWTRKDFDTVMMMLTQILAQQQQYENALSRLVKQQEKRVMSALDDLRQQVQENTDLEQSAVTAIQGIAEQLREALANDDDAALQALAQQLDASAAALGSAIAANTAAAADPNAPEVNPLSRKK